MLSEYVREQQCWRKAKADEFPDDRRNRQSADALASLAEYVEQLEGEGPDGESWEALERLEPHLFEGVTLGGERAARETSRYGFGYGVTDGSHEEFLTDLWIACMEDAYDYAREHETDPTETLHPVELEAAQTDIPLPPNYWRRRSRAFKEELEAEIEELIAAATAEE